MDNVAKTMQKPAMTGNGLYQLFMVWTGGWLITVLITLLDIFTDVNSNKVMVIHDLDALEVPPF